MKAEGVRLKGALGPLCHFTDRVRWTRVCLGWAALGLLGVALGATRVEIDRMTEGDLFPGDLLEVKIAAVDSEYHRYELVEPNHSALRFVATQAFPVRLNSSNEYESEWMVIYQILQSGSAILEGGFLESTSEGEQARIPLESLELEALGFGSETDHDAVERFEADSLMGKTVSKGWGIGLVIGLIALFYLAKRVRLRRETLQTEVAEDSFGSEVSSLRLELSSGKTPRHELERFLACFRSRCSPLLVKEIELYLYSKSGDVRALENLIGKECSK